MKREVGVWIDNHKTVMVTMINEQEEIREIRSNVEKHFVISSGRLEKKINISRMSMAEDMMDRRYTNHLNEYYDGVVSLLRNADTVWIFGPGEAKGELKKRLELDKPGRQMVSIETADRMTNRQILAKVRQHYVG